MGKFFKIVLILVGMLYVCWDIYTSLAKNIDIHTTVRVVVYSILINLVSHWFTDSDKNRELDRITYERDLLHDLLLKKDKISSTKIKNSIKKLERKNNSDKNKNRR